MSSRHDQVLDGGASSYMETSMTIDPSSVGDEPRLVIAYGLDQNQKAHVGVFATADLAAVARAATSVGFEHRLADTPALRSLAEEIPIGKLYATGKGFVPFVRRELYDQLMTALGEDTAGPEIKTSEPLPESEPVSQTETEDPTATIENGPTSVAAETEWGRLAVGELVLAQESPDEGWWEAVVLEKRGETALVKWRDFPRQPSVERPKRQIVRLAPIG